MVRYDGNDAEGCNRATVYLLHQQRSIEYNTRGIDIKPPKFNISMYQQGECGVLSRG